MKEMDGEDPGILDLMDEMSRVLDWKDNSKPEVVRLLLTSSPCWSEDQLRAIHLLRAPYLANILQDAKLLIIQRNPVRDVRVDYYRQVTEEVSKNWKNGTVQSKHTENNGARGEVQSRMTNSQATCKSSPVTITLNTGSVYHRGMPIIERRSVSTFPGDGMPSEAPHLDSCRAANFNG